MGSSAPEEWPIGSFLATTVFLLVVGVEMALAERAAPGEDPDEEDDEGDGAER